MHRPFALAAILMAIVAASLTLGSPQSVLAHCEVPCGIYGDHARIEQMLEDTTTIGKAAGQIVELAAKSDPLSQNQLVRWVNTKEEHATRIQQTIAQYFLTQRVKPAPLGTPEGEAYQQKLVQHHAVLLAAMKAKQGVDPSLVKALARTIETIAPYYPAPAQEGPGGEHQGHDHR